MNKPNGFDWENEFEYDYIEEADILEIFFNRGAATSAVEIAENVTLRFNQENREAMSLILNNYSHLVEPAQFGPRSFRLNIEHLPPSTQEIVLQITSRPPVNRFIRMLSYTTSPDGKVIPIAAIQPS
jgi:hypothetical protein